MIQLHRVHFVGDLLSELWALEVSQTGMCTAFASAARWYLMTESNMTLSRAGCTCFNSRCYQRLQEHCWHRESSLKAPHTTTIAAYLQCPEEPHETRGTGVFRGSHVKCNSRSLQIGQARFLFLPLTVWPWIVFLTFLIFRLH